ncbi:YeiH family protein [Sedimentitalea sp. JM2-8]|uniref:YeiH family protein n=1 Tax=Sedimentitalea xiamensis TaxID=3050037 RepID=A0ABT7FFL1_9RHOB|nr:YeiH family protein [Sedimentitalea xiamensis]MDK3073911.1 YeiH family protein [Sedimentitalea xiamensis]
MVKFPFAASPSRLRLTEAIRSRLPGILVALVIGIAAQFLSDHYGAPAMLMALLLGIAFHFLAEEGQCAAGIDFTARTVLRIGVALLGARISIDMLIGLGAPLIILTICGVVLTIGVGLLGARLLGRGWRFGLLTGGAVAICGASAAMAIAAVLPRNEHSEKNLIFTVLTVTVLSTVAMVLYPTIARFFGLDDLATGVFLGGTIHDVAQVVGAGFSVSEQTGETAALVKLFRVTMLVPVVLSFSLVVRSLDAKTEAGEACPPLVPVFVWAFLALGAIHSFGLIPARVSDLLSDLSRWALLVAIAAVGMKTALRTIFDVGGQAIALMAAETLFLAVFILVGLHWLA